MATSSPTDGHKGGGDWGGIMYLASPILFKASLLPLCNLCLLLPSSDGIHSALPPFLLQYLPIGT